ncbi:MULTISPECIES: molybdopterin converting factor subunit 1 [Peribacillus]|uniref:Molybdopterin synthase sulfur carrier subunit n=1 Tax=Peribacillus simplex TaxID=1478 RepID=A0A109MUI4_9BACI|nr:molybdopterin converting factor subunit 1 [Peribacillus simplex]KWW15504.1 molybdopterin synthase sulfur carrier subunit [Peribacillus simplex]
MITVLFFAEIREVIGLDRIIIKKDRITVLQLKQYFESKYPLLSFEPFMTAINESFVTDEEMIKDQDTVAFIPPVSGG